MKREENEIKINLFPGGGLVKLILSFYKKLKGQTDTDNRDNSGAKTFQHETLKKYKSESIFIEPSEKVKEIFNGSEKFPFLSIYVHGSWADDTQTPFSDLDDLVIISEEKISTTTEAKKVEAWLNKIDMQFCRIDPLQHHGHWILYENELKNYDESHIPLSVLYNAMRIQGFKKIEYAVNLEKTKAGLKRNINITRDNIAKWMPKYTAGKINSYEMKAFIGSFLLMPAYIFQYKGNELSKKDAIEGKREIFSSESCILLEKCSEIRNKWGIVTGSFNFNLLKAASFTFTNPHLFRRFSMKFAPRFPKEQFPLISEGEVKRFIEEINIHAHY